MLLQPIGFVDKGVFATLLHDLEWHAICEYDGHIEYAEVSDVCRMSVETTDLIRAVDKHRNLLHQLRPRLNRS